MSEEEEEEDVFESRLLRFLLHVISFLSHTEINPDMSSKLRTRLTFESLTHTHTQTCSEISGEVFFLKNCNLQRISNVSIKQIYQQHEASSEELKAAVSRGGHKKLQKSNRPHRLPC